MKVQFKVLKLNYALKISIMFFLNNKQAIKDIQRI